MLTHDFWIPALVHLLLAGEAAAWPWHRPKAPVCVVGAGPAGLTAAYTLQQKGYETVVFDKQSAVGGKCQSYYAE
ncbi:MAG: FAD-dependent oxidoreductase [Terriglobus roseus]|nr:FAD-dependent oxidoreductase [Terriglobus roseus]